MMRSFPGISVPPTILLACLVGLSCSRPSFTDTTATVVGSAPQVAQEELPFVERDPFTKKPPGPAPIPLSEDELPTTLPELLVSWTALGPNVFVETIRDPVNAAALLLADRAARIGEVANGTDHWAVIPRQLVLTQRRDPALPRRAIVTTTVCSLTGQEIPLEHLLTCFHAGKDHESVISANFDAQHLHIALLACGLKPGKPASFVNEKRDFDYKPATGDKVRVLVQYQAQDRLVTHRAQRWVKNADSGQELKIDWVFAGSTLWPDEEGKRPPFYGGNEGRVICVSNFINAVLDLPIPSSEMDSDRLFRANAKLIPPRLTPVTVILEPLPSTK